MHERSWMPVKSKKIAAAAVVHLAHNVNIYCKLRYFENEKKKTDTKKPLRHNTKIGFQFVFLLLCRSVGRSIMWRQNNKKIHFQMQKGWTSNRKPLKLVNKDIKLSWKKHLENHLNMTETSWFGMLSTVCSRRIWITFRKTINILWMNRRDTQTVLGENSFPYCIDLNMSLDWAGLGHCSHYTSLSELDAMSQTVSGRYF